MSSPLRLFAAAAAAAVLVSGCYGDALDKYCEGAAGRACGADADCCDGFSCVNAVCVAKGTATDAGMDGGAADGGDGGEADSGVSYTLHVSTDGGTLTASAINCPPDCSASYPAGRQVTIMATPPDGGCSPSWTGDCADAGNTCTLVMNENKAVAVGFDPGTPKTINVGINGAGLGSVRLPDGGSCVTPPCSFQTNSCAAPTTIQLVATPNLGNGLYRWTGLCQASGQEFACTPALPSGSSGSTAAWFVEANRAFVTKDPHPAAIFTDAGAADEQCRLAASSVSLPGTYVAFVSTPTVGAAARIRALTNDGGFEPRGWKRIDGPSVADTLTDFSGPKTQLAGGNYYEGGPVFYPITFAETNSPVPEFSPVATATDFHGAPFQRCADAGFLYGGVAWATTGIAVGEQPKTCADSYQLYCLGVDRSVHLRTEEQPASGKRVFLSRRAANDLADPVNGISELDGLCQADAADAGYSGTFIAGVATTSQSLSQRMANATPPWYRPDGVLAINSGTFGPGFTLVAPINVTADRRYLMGFAATGAAGLDVPGSASTTCQNWTDWSGSAQVSRGGAAYANGSWFVTPGTAACNSAPLRVYCLQTN